MMPISSIASRPPLGVRELARQGAVGDDMEPLGLAGDPEAGLVDMQGRLLQEMGHGGLLP